MITMTEEDRKLIDTLRKEEDKTDGLGCIAFVKLGVLNVWAEKYEEAEYWWKVVLDKVESICVEHEHLRYMPTFKALRKLILYNIEQMEIIKKMREPSILDWEELRVFFRRH